jgi:hypothetical protein
MYPIFGKTRTLKLYRRFRNKLSLQTICTRGPEILIFRLHLQNTVPVAAHLSNIYDMCHMVCTSMNECDFCQDRYLVGKTNLTFIIQAPHHLAHHPA